MHTRVVVLTDSWQEGTLSIPDVSEFAPWADYSDVGGRWTGWFSEVTKVAPKYGDVLPFVGHRAAVENILAILAREENETFLSLRDQIAGNPVAVGAHDGHILGQAVAPTADSAAATTIRNQELSAEWASVTRSPTLEEARQIALTGLASHSVHQFMSLVTEEFTCDSVFYDLVTYTPNVSNLLPDLTRIFANEKYGGCDIKTLALAVLDVHF